MNEKTSTITISSKSAAKRRLKETTGRGFLLAVTSVAALSVLAIIAFIARDALPFFRDNSLREFFFSTSWFPTHDPAEFGDVGILLCSLLVYDCVVVFVVAL